MLAAIYSIFVILFCLGCGYLTYAIIDLIPASLYGLFYLAIGLHLGLFNAGKIEQTVNWIIKHMGICFVPAGVGIINYVGLIQSSGLQILLFTVVTTIAIMVLVGLWYQKLINECDND